MPAAAPVSQEILKPLLEIEGGHRLSGELKVSGAKNSALVLMTAALLCNEPLRLSNVPELTDIDGMSEILRALGVHVQRNGSTVEIHAGQLQHGEPPYDLVNGLRASFFAIGPLLGRLGSAKVPLPGGCRIGARPVVEHIRGLKALGAVVNVEHGVVSAAVPGRGKRLRGASIVLDCPSVGATETILMAAVLANGTSVIENAAQEPEVQDLANLLNIMGARITGAGGPTITVEGVEALHGCSYAVIPDRIEAGTFLLAAAITRSRLRVAPVVPEHLSAVLQKLRDCGCDLEIDDEGITITPGDIQGVDLTTQPFPGFPTDLQAPFMALLATARGTSVITEKIYENRMQHVAELQRMGASIRLQGNTAVVEGVPQLSGAPVTGSDLRAAAAMVLAALAARGKSQVSGLNHLDRGYDAIEAKLGASGARLQRQAG
ncbi:UDP-N-acetylglucosamine 1-carboxyvinyltransferase [Synechococcus sp. RS9909]|uniref:UDP-N-acetylglucosamine 1-carboxyvinyltransferase n=1 Tax=unclassified Synechococcus TaxID=2626047 RepID=UPI000068FC6E|nr:MULTISPECIES: UDP-N-acetylglucosamine 1-carboxyvinyltransferase [unclassified Synechococcus]EAQ68076.1 UDP-N-glucosamine 1-carboxyvinyltransferase [Synechococcus sp. RS9917]QNI78763.1 UDP-N-acetylglucosamine 1-carboxyvinyltransferase [Synechococcus sp. RS9909]